MRQQLKVLSEFLKTFSVVDLRPDTHAVKHSGGAVPHVLSNPGREYAMYFDGSGTIQVTLDLPPGQYSEEWINVISGHADKSKTFHHRGREVILDAPDCKNGIALRLKRTGR